MRTLAQETKAAEERTAGFEEEIRETNESAEASEEMIRGAIINQETYSFLFVQWISERITLFIKSHSSRTNSV